MTRSRCAGWIVLAAMMIAPGVASAVPFQFVFTDTIDAISGTFSGVSIDDTFTLTVVADNGGSAAASQQWFDDDVLSASLSVAGGTYVASYTPPSSCTDDFCFETDSNGDLTRAIYEHDEPPVLGTDTFGSDGNLLFGFTAFRNSTGSGVAGYGSQALGDWAIIPEPSTLSLAALGLLGLAANGRRRKP